MYDEQKSAYIISQSACMMVELAAMQAANAQSPDNQPYTEHQIRELIESYGLHHNGVISMLNGG